MDIFTRIKEFLPTFTKGNQQAGGGQWVSFLGGDNGLSRNISDRALMNADKNWVYIAVDKIAENLSMVPYKLLKFNPNGEDEEVDDHPVLDLLENPNAMMSGVDLLYIIATHLELTGNAYLLRDKENNPTKLTLLTPEHTNVVLTADRMDIKGYDYRVGGFHAVYPPELVTHIKYPNPRNPLQGRGTLSQIAEWVDTDQYATEFNRKFFINGVAPGGSLETEATTREGLELAKLGLEMKYKGASNAHKTMILPKGSKYVAPKTNQRDMEFNQSLITTRNNILAGFGVPKSVVGISETGDSRSDAESAHFAFMFFTIKPKIARLEKYLNEKLLALFDNGRNSVYIKFEDPVPDNQEATLNRRSTSLGKKAWKTINEIRAEEGLEPLEGGDELKNEGSTFRLTEDKKMKKLNKKAPYRHMVQTKRTEEAKEKTVDSVVDKAIAALNKVHEKSQEEKEEEMHKQFEDRTERKVDKLAQNFKDYDRKLKEQVLTELDDVQNPQEIKGYKVKEITDNLGMDRSEMVKATIEFSEPILQEIIKTEGAIRFNEIDGAEGTFDPRHERIQKVLRDAMQLMAESYTDTTLKVLEEKLLEAITAGDSMVEIRNTVAEVFELTESYRAKTIAHTEVFRIANAAGREAFKQSEVVQAVRWHTAEDEMVCPYCAPMNGKIVDIDQPFFKKGDTLTGDDGKVLELNYSDVFDPPLHVNCRCFTLPETIDIGEADAEDVAETKDVDDEVEFLSKAIEILQHGSQKETQS